MKLFHKTTDERVRAEANHVYKIGYYILSFGILADIILQATGATPAFLNAELGALSLEFWVFMIANLACAVLLARRGLMDDNAYAEADVFPTAHYIRVGLATGVLTGVLWSLLMWVSGGYWATLRVPDLLMVAGMTIVFMALLITAGVVVLQYVLFRAAKKRRDRQSEE